MLGALKQVLVDVYLYLYLAAVTVSPLSKGMVDNTVQFPSNFCTLPFL